VADAQEQLQKANLTSGGLPELRAQVEQRCLDDRLTDVSAHLIAGDTRGAARLVEGTLAELTGGQGKAADAVAGLGKGGALAGDVLRLDRQDAALSRLETALQAGPERRARLLALDTTDAPADVTQTLRDLRGLDALRVTLSKPDKANLPGVDQVEAALGTAARAGDAAAAGRLRQDVSARLFLEGRAGDARKVLAAGPGDPEHAAALLRDMKAAVLGEGKVGTAAVADV